MVMSQILLNLTPASFFRPEFFVKRVVINDEDGNTHLIANYESLPSETKEVIDNIEVAFGRPDLLVVYLSEEETVFDIGFKKNEKPHRHEFSILPESIVELIQQLVSKFTELES